MDDQLDFGYQAKFPLDKLNIIIRRQSDPYAVQPWEKNTLEYQKQQTNTIRPFKTFYRTKPFAYNKNAIYQKNYATQRTFSFTKQLQAAQVKRIKQNSHQKQKNSIGDTVSRVSFVNHYNINGNIISPQQNKKEENHFNNRFYSQRIKAMKNKNKQKSERMIEQFDVSGQWVGLKELKRRVSLKKQKALHQDKQYFRLKSQNSQKKIEIKLQNASTNIKERRRSKVISLGFQKISIQKHLLKQKSVFL